MSPSPGPCCWCVSPLSSAYSAPDDLRHDQWDASWAVPTILQLPKAPLTSFRHRGFRQFTETPAFGTRLKRLLPPKWGASPKFADVECRGPLHVNAAVRSLVNDVARGALALEEFTATDFTDAHRATH
jgi:hypothetical protein